MPPEKRAPLASPRKFSLAFREAVCADLDHLSIRAAGRKHGVSKQVITKWARERGISTERKMEPPKLKLLAPVQAKPTKSVAIVRAKTIAIALAAVPVVAVAPAVKPSRPRVVVLADQIATCPPHLRIERSWGEWECQKCHDVKIILRFAPQVFVLGPTDQWGEGQ